jgi:multiple sugar transport system substrate-binding protein
MRKKMKKFDIALLCTAFAALICAFIFYPVKKINFGQTTLVFSQWLKNDMPEEFVEKIIAEFEENNPAIRIVLEDKSYEAVKDDISVYLEAARNEKSDEKSGSRGLPDIVLLDPLWLDDSEKQVLFLGRSDSKVPDADKNVYTTPLYCYFNALFYNIGVLGDAGFDRPPGTRGEFEEVCLKLKEKNIYGLLLSDNFFADIFPWIWSGGYSLEELDLPKDAFDFTGKNAVESIEFLNALSRQNLLGRQPSIKNEDEKVKNFIAGKTAMITASSRLIKYFATEQGGLNFGVTAIPYPENNPARPVFNTNGVHAAILSTSWNDEAAQEFVRFLESKRSELAAVAGAVPVGIPVFDDQTGQPDGQSHDTPTTEPVYTKARQIFESAESVDDWKFFSDCATLGIIGNEEIYLMFTSNRNAKDTAAAIQKRYADSRKNEEAE